MSSPLEAVKALAEVEPVFHSSIQSGQICVYCGALREPDFPEHPMTDHAPDCPWLQMPKIVAALESAERFAGTTYVHPGDMIPERFIQAANINALVAALKGGVVPSEGRVLTI